MSSLPAGRRRVAGGEPGPAHRFAMPCCVVLPEHLARMSIYFIPFSDGTLFHCGTLLIVSGPQRCLPCQPTVLRK